MPVGHRARQTCSDTKSTAHSACRCAVKHRGSQVTLPMSCGAAAAGYTPRCGAPCAGPCLRVDCYVGERGGAAEADDHLQRKRQWRQLNVGVCGNSLRAEMPVSSNGLQAGPEEPRSRLPRLPTVSLPQATRHLLSQSFSQNSCEGARREAQRGRPARHRHKRGQGAGQPPTDKPQPQPQTTRQATCSPRLP